MLPDLLDFERKKQLDKPVEFRHTYTMGRPNWEVRPFLKSNSAIARRRLVPAALLM